MGAKVTAAIVDLVKTHGDTAHDALDLLKTFQQKVGEGTDYRVSVIDRHIFVNHPADLSTVLALDCGTGEVVIDALGLFGEKRTVSDLLKSVASQITKVKYDS